MSDIINIQHTLDTAVAQTKVNAQSGQSLLCLSAVAGGIHTYRMSPTLNGYTAGMVIHWQPSSDVAGPATLDIDDLGARPMKQSDGASDALAGQIQSGRMHQIWYDGAMFRLLALSGTATAHHLLVGLDFASSGHTGFQPALQFTPQDSSQKNQPNGYPGLDAQGRVAAAHMPERLDYVFLLPRMGEAPTSWAAIPVLYGAPPHRFLATAYGNAQADYIWPLLLPIDWAGNAVSLRIIAGAAGGVVGQINWTLYTQCVGEGEALDANTWSSGQPFSFISPAVTHARVTVTIPDVDLAGCSPGDHLSLRVRRHGDTDPYNGNGYVYGLEVEYKRQY